MFNKKYILRKELEKGPGGRCSSKSSRYFRGGENTMRDGTKGYIDADCRIQIFDQR